MWIRQLTLLAITFSLVLPVEQVQPRPQEDPLAATLSPKLIGAINEYCAIRVQTAFSLCQSLCGQDGVEAFDPGFCGSGANCKCVVREDAPGIQ